MKFHSNVDDVLHESHLISQVYYTESRVIDRYSLSQESYSQETFMDSLKSTLKMYYSDMFWVLKMFDKGANEAKQEAVSLLDEIKVLKEKNINNNKTVNISGVSHLGDVKSAADLIAKLQKYNDTILGSKGSGTIDTLSDGLEKITKIIREAWFSTEEAQDARIDEIRDLSYRTFKDLVTLNSTASGDLWHVKHGLGGSSSLLSFNEDGEASIAKDDDYNKNYNEMKTLSSTEKDKLIAILEKMLSKDDIENSISRMVKNMQTLYGYTWVNDKLRFSGLIGKILFGWFTVGYHLFANTSDLKRAMSFTSLAEVTKTFWLKELSERNKVVRACISYIQASCN